MSSFRAPLPPEPWFVDDDGTRFQYGTQHYFEDGAPMESAYSRDSHPERFAPLHTAADRLVEWLISEFDVVADDDAAAVVADRAWTEPMVRGVRLTPSAPDAAPLVMLWTDYPGVMVLAGTMLAVPVPPCGCDACDETAATAVEQLESTVHAVIAGGLTERFDGSAGFVHVTAPGWSSTSQAKPWTSVETALSLLSRVRDGHWVPWPRKAT